MLTSSELLAAGRHNRGKRIDDVLPEVVERTVRRPHVAQNDYISHRVTLPAPGDRLACDCGDAFDTATELEHHQSAYRHRVPDFRPRRLR